MQRFLTWLLSLEHITLSQGSRLSLDWQQPLDAWVWFLLLVLVPAYVVLVYRADGGRRGVRVLMACLRCAVILLAIVLLCQPVVVLRRDRVEPATLAVMIDQSLSMARSDAHDLSLGTALAAGLPDAAGVDRWATAVAALGVQDGTMLQALLEHHQIRLFRFAGAVSAEDDLAEPQAVGAVLQSLAGETPDGQTTHIAGAIKQVFDACVDAHLAAVVLLSDGQPTDEADWSRVAALSRARGAPIHVIPVGSARPPKDLGVEDAQVDPVVYLGDTIAVRFKHRHIGLEPGTPYTVRLHEVDRETVLAAQSYAAGAEDGVRSAELQFKPDRLGVLELVVDIPVHADEVDVHNNRRRLRVNVVDDKIKVLYVDGYPRYEYRYLKNTLLREPTLVSSVLLLSADARFAQEGSAPIRRFPGSAEELADYDVILMGDVDPLAGWLSEAQMELIVDFVGRRGGGFGIIAGQTYTPLRFSGTPLERLLPIDLQRSEPELVVDPTQSFQPRPTAIGRDGALLRLLPDEQQARDLWDRLPGWHWCFGAARRVSAVEVLLEHPTETLGGHPIPLAVVGRYGAGQIFYQGSDDSWRWRRHRGEALFDTYWVQIIRFLGRHKKLEGHRTVMLQVQPPRVEPQQAVLISLEVGDVDLARQLPDRVEVAVRRADDPHAVQIALQRSGSESTRFQGNHLPDATGQYEVAFGGEPPDVPPADAGFEVRRQSAEDARVQANPELLAELARLTGGVVLQPWEAAALPDHLPQRQYVVPDDVVETIWDSRLALALFAILIVIEWLLRKLSGLP